MSTIMKLLATTILLLMFTSILAPNAANVQAQLGGSRVHEVAQPPNVRLDSSFSPATVFNPALSPIGGAPFCSSARFGTILCYPPAFLKKAYDFPTLYTGTSQTIVIVDAFGSLTIQGDLNTYDAAFAIQPATITKLCPPSFSGLATDTCPDTTADFSSNPAPGSISYICGAQGWANETTLDVTQAHGLAPGAKIYLVEAASCYDSDINTAEMAVVSQVG